MKRDPWFFIPARIEYNQGVFQACFERFWSDNRTELKGDRTHFIRTTYFSPSLASGDLIPFSKNLSEKRRLFLCGIVRNMTEQAANLWNRVSSNGQEWMLKNRLIISQLIYWWNFTIFAKKTQLFLSVKDSSDLKPWTLAKGKLIFLYILSSYMIIWKYYHALQRWLVPAPTVCSARHEFCG